MASSPPSSPGADALSKLSGICTPERWQKIQDQATVRDKDLAALCVQCLAAAALKHPSNDVAAQRLALNRLLVLVGSVPNAEDVGRYEAAVKGAAYVPPAPVAAPAAAPAPTPAPAAAPSPVPVPTPAPAPTKDSAKS